jgi:biopolymer transport protein ExbD
MPIAIPANILLLSNFIFLVINNTLIIKKPISAAMKAALVPFIQKDTSQQSTIVINADKAVPLESVVEVMRIARELNARTVLAVNRNAQ